MSWLVAILGAGVAALGGLGLVRPATLLALVERTWRGGRGPLLAVGIRVVLGVALLWAAPDSRHPAALQVLGAFSLLAAAAVPLLGAERLGRFVDWWAQRPPSFVRAWAVVAIGFGAFLVYAVL